MMRAAVRHAAVARCGRKKQRFLSGLLPKAEAAEVDFAALAEKMTRRKEKLLAGGVPPVGEERMVKASRGKGDSPASAAGRKPPRLPKGRKR